MLFDLFCSLGIRPHACGSPTVLWLTWCILHIKLQNKNLMGCFMQLTQMRAKWVVPNPFTLLKTWGNLQSTSINLLFHHPFFSQHQYLFLHHCLFAMTINLKSTATLRLAHWQPGNGYYDNIILHPAYMQVDEGNFTILKVSDPSSPTSLLCCKKHPLFNKQTINIIKAK